jgi:hypothetical protein
MKAILLMTVLLAGCGRSWDMDVGAWHRATLACEKHGGVLAADYDQSINRVVARCADGSVQLAGRPA